MTNIHPRACLNIQRPPHLIYLRVAKDAALRKRAQELVVLFLRRGDFVRRRRRGRRKAEPLVEDAAGGGTRRRQHLGQEGEVLYARWKPSYRPAAAEASGHN